jgi:succinate dehydrogenase hydrophobic anchor subunit
LATSIATTPAPDGPRNPLFQRLIALLLLLYTLWIAALIGAALNAAIDADRKR